MKKLLALLIIATIVIPSTALAWGYHGPRHGGYHSGYRNSWVAPVIIGGAIGYGATRIFSAPSVIYTQPAPVYVTPSVVEECSPWIETQQPNGTIVRERTCYPK